MWPWIALVIVTPAVVFLTFAMQTGSCETPTPGTDSLGCSTGPVVGMPGAIAIGVVCVALFTLAVIRIVLLSLRRAGGL